MAPAVSRTLPYALPAALAVLLLVAFAGVLRRDELHLAGTNSVPLREPVVEVPPGQRLCQHNEVVPADAAAVRLFAVWGPRGPRGRLTLRDGAGRLISGAPLEAERDGVLIARLAGVSRTVGGATLCVENADRLRLALAGDTSPVAPVEVDGKRRRKVAVTVLYLDERPESWASLLPRMVGRVGAAHLMRGWVGWLGIACALAALGVALATALRAGRGEA